MLFSRELSPGELSREEYTSPLLSVLRNERLQNLLQCYYRTRIAQKTDDEQSRKSKGTIKHIYEVCNNTLMWGPPIIIILVFS